MPSTTWAKKKEQSHPSFSVSCRTVHRARMVCCDLLFVKLPFGRLFHVNQEEFIFVWFVCPSSTWKSCFAFCKFYVDMFVVFVGVDVSMPGVMFGMSHDTTTFDQPKFRPDTFFPHTIPTSLLSVYMRNCHISIRAPWEHDVDMSSLVDPSSSWMQSIKYARAQVEERQLHRRQRWTSPKFRPAASPHFSFAFVLFDLFQDDLRLVFWTPAWLLCVMLELFASL